MSTEDWNARNALNQGIWTDPSDPSKHYWQIGDLSFDSSQKRGIVSPTLYPRFRTQIKKTNFIKQLPTKFLRLHLL